jgi:hypothetical protein
MASRLLRFTVLEILKRVNMRITHLFLLSIIGASSSSHAVLWPIAEGMQIINCGYGPSCSGFVEYSWSGTSFIEIPSPKPSTATTTEVGLFGVHCDMGDRVGNFLGCRWDGSGTIHSRPLVGACQTISETSWKLKDPTRCHLKPGTTEGYGGHNGAAPGAECAVYGKKTWVGDDGPSAVLLTPWGPLTPETVANSYSQYCVKAPNPNITCTIDIPDGGVLDHGFQPPTSVSSRKVVAAVNCSTNPHVDVVGGTTITLDKSVRSDLTIGKVVDGQMTIESTLTTTNASAGAYSGSVIIAVSPP